MRKSLAVAVALLFAAPLYATPLAVPVSEFEWSPDVEDFGGLSGLEVDKDGLGFTAVSDDGVLYSGTLLRDGAGDLIGADIERSQPLLIEDGTRPDPKRFRDMEGLALLSDGQLAISAESRPRILIYSDVSGTPLRRELPKRAKRAPSNIGFEAFAVSQGGALFLIPEGTNNIFTPFPIFRSSGNDVWTRIYGLPRVGGFRPVGADFGPDGHLYVLTRSFIGFAFQTRIDRVIFVDGEPIRHQHLFTSSLGQFDNLEGLAVWQGAAGSLRLLAVSDDNFSRFQRTMMVEFLLQE